MPLPSGPEHLLAGSMIAFHREARDRAEQVRIVAEAVQVRNGLLDQQVSLPPRPLRAEQRDERLLARGLVLADALAGFLLEPLMIDQVVGDLEGQADVAGIAPEPGAALGRRPAHDRPGLDAPADQGARLQL